MADIFKPNLAGKVENFDAIPFPVLASYKIDGVRAMRFDKVMSRSMKPIPSKHVQATLASEYLHGLDGELTVGSPTDPNCMQNTTSGVMAIDKVPLFQFHVFDHIKANDTPFIERYAQVASQVARIQARWVQLSTANRLEGGAMVTVCPVVLVPHVLIHSLDELLAYEAARLAEGWEGVMIRQPNGLYKQGRSTAKEGGLLKVKRFTDDEAMIIGFVEEQQNNNVKTVNELGRSKRSSHAAGKTGKDTLGALHVRNGAGTEFHVGSGFDDALAAEIWANREKYMGRLITYKSFLIGVKDAPRHPVFKSFRDPMDTSK